MSKNDSVFIDTAGWANLFIATESCHQQAVQWFSQARQQKSKMVTTNYILLELVALLNSRVRISHTKLFDYIEAAKTAPYINLIHIDAAIDTAAWTLLKNRPDKDWSLVDASSFVIMQRMEIYEALTTDHHFEQAGFIRLLKPANLGITH